MLRRTAPALIVAALTGSGVAILANTVELPDGVLTVLFLLAVFIPVVLAVELEWRDS
jgi:hypothetical protein